MMERLCFRELLDLVGGKPSNGSFKPSKLSTKGSKQISPGRTE